MMEREEAEAPFFLPCNQHQQFPWPETPYPGDEKMFALIPGYGYVYEQFFTESVPGVFCVSGDHLFLGSMDREKPDPAGLPQMGG